ncbi:methyltransferase, FkbM family domain protein [hydrothermal vent metagenome]|uniref:Methyltransferase, FkbM family domain protein n=1 Tax=hydrothermal vent metagenome TaxID=652676 RepID=A0A1W1BSP2_9ZZZZ
MKQLIKDSIKPLYHYMKNKNEREFIRLYDRWSHIGRYKRVDGVEFLSYRFDVPDLLSFIWQFKEHFVYEIYRFKSNTKTPTIYDCGANIGITSLYFKSIYPLAKIYAFEADPQIAKILQKNLSTNGIDDVDIIDAAVWIDDNGIKFAIEGADGGSIYGDGKKIEMRSVRLKEYLESEKHIDLLKIDIEGAEVEVLNDCKDSLSNIDNIFIEYHSWSNKKQNFSSILKILEESGFRYYIEDIKKRKTPFINKDRDKSMDLQLNIFAYRI